MNPEEEKLLLDHVWALYQNLDPDYNSAALVDACYFFYEHYGFEANVLPADLYDAVISIKKEEMEYD
mgnify:CR=1 FL=1